jgi:NTP pyrophosphatase (non-canonical NTP hydrolase)
MTAFNEEFYAHIDGTVQCPMCGKEYPHRHSGEEVVIYRNGMKRAFGSHHNLRHLQQMVGSWHVNTFGDGGAPDRVMLKLASEAGELADAVLALSSETLYTSGKGDVADEAADVLITLLSLTHRLGVDLADALDSKLPRVMAKHGAAVRSNAHG